MRANILADNGRPLVDQVEVVIKVEERGMAGQFISGFFARLPDVPFNTGDQFLLLFRDEDAKELGIANLFRAVAYPKGDIVDFRPFRPSKW